MTTEEKISKLEADCKAMTAEIEKLKAELAEKNETAWVPKIGDLYAYVTSDGTVAKNTTYYNDNTLDSDRIDFNNAYPSSDKTQKHLEWYCDNVLFVQNKLMQLHELLCPDYFPDWEDDDKPKFYFICVTIINTMCGSMTVIGFIVIVWFISLQKQQKRLVKFLTEKNLWWNRKRVKLMPRLIDLDKLLEFPVRLNHYDKEHGDINFVYGVETVLEYAENLPIIDAAEILNKEKFIMEDIGHESIL